MSSAPPTSDIRTRLLPFGATSRMSVSSGKVLVKLFSVTVTLVTVPVSPPTEILAGYGLPVPDPAESLMVITAGLENTTANAGLVRKVIRLMIRSWAATIRKERRHPVGEQFFIDPSQESSTA